MFVFNHWRYWWEGGCLVRAHAFLYQLHNDAAQTLLICIDVVDTWLVCVARFSNHTDDKLAAMPDLIHLPDEGGHAFISWWIVQKL